MNTNFGFFFSPSLPLLSIITITFIFCFYTKFRLRQLLLLLLLWLNLDFFFLCSTLVQILLVVFYDGWHFHKFFVLYYFMQKTNDDWKGKKGSLYHIIIIKWNQIPFSLKTVDCLSSLMMMVSIRFLFDFFSYSSFDIIIIFFLSSSIWFENELFFLHICKLWFLVWTLISIFYVMVAVAVVIYIRHNRQQ